MKKLGRPTLPDKQRLSGIVQVRLTSREFKILQLAAKRLGKTVSQLVRECLPCSDVKLYPDCGGDCDTILAAMRKSLGR